MTTRPFKWNDEIQQLGELYDHIQTVRQELNIIAFKIETLMFRMDQAHLATLRDPETLEGG